MTPQHLVEHLGGIMVISTGRFEVKAMYEEERLKQNYTYIIQGRKGLTPNGIKNATAATLKPLRFKDLTEAKVKLKTGLEAFMAYYEAHPEVSNLHPAFGQLNFEEWAYFHAMHSQYHLYQFGQYDYKWS